MIDYWYKEIFSLAILGPIVASTLLYSSEMIVSFANTAGSFDIVVSNDPITY